MAPKYKPNPFQYEAAYDAIEALARQLGPDAPELGALGLVECAWLFILAPPRSFTGEDGHILVSLEELLADQERGHAFVAALAPWVLEVKPRATAEQQQFLRQIGLEDAQEEGALRTGSVEEKAGHDAQSVDASNDGPRATTLPEPAYAVSVLESLAQRLDARTAAHTCVELAVKTLRFLLDTKEVEALCAYLDEAGMPHTPTGEPEPAA